ncbi:MAG: amidase [Actinobacteria bacterium]|nr:amidase [Actinomycetota bacterium]
MPAADPTLWTATEQGAAIARRELGSEELLELCLRRIDQVDPAVNAVCTLAAEAARSRAQEADAATARGESWGLLHGLPITIKDAIATDGIRSTGGAVVLRDNVPGSDAPAVASLKSAGAIVFGKTNLPEWSGDWQSFNDMFGTTNNPWDLTRTPGGSSGGAAAAVACGMTSFELGTDIGGSVRVPSAFCGVFGHKPSFGLIPTLGYLDEPAAWNGSGGDVESDVNTFGPIARGIDDLELLIDVLARPTPDRSAGWQLRLPPAPFESLNGLRVGAWIDEPALEIDGEMTTILNGVVDDLESAGAFVDRQTRPALDVEAAWRLGARLIGEAVNVSAAGDQPGALTHRGWMLLHRERARLRRAWAEFFEGVDVLLCPVTLVPAFAHQQAGNWADRRMTINGKDRPYLELEGWPALIGAAYLPGTVVPVGFTAAGLPIGMQVVAPYLHDRSALKAAALIADTRGGYVPPPLVR